MIINKKQWLGAALVVECLALSACMAVPGEPEGPTLADLRSPIPAPAVAPEVTATIDDVKQLFEAALVVTEVANDRHRIQQRLAGLALQEGEAAAAGGQSGPFLNEAIGRYDALLVSHPDDPGNDYLLYQQAKAYELAGQQSQAQASLDRLSEDYPSSKYTAEVHFRRGEMLYADRQYRLAQNAYARVVADGSDGLFYHNAMYMLGWAQFKQGDYPAAVQSFSVILDAEVPASGELAAVEPSSMGMVSDTLRALSLAFSHEQGVTTLDDVFAERAPHYLPLLYSSLAAHYLDKERFRDAAETSSFFVERYPESPYAPQFSVSVVECYTAGGFPSMTVPAMQFYVENYGIHSRYWARSDDLVRSQLRPQLRTYLDQLARHEHALGQTLIAAADERQDSSTDDSELARQHLGIASRWYREFVETVPDDPQSPEMIFLMAESLFDAADYPAAVVAYEEAAYGDRRVENDAEAGYAALLAYDRHIAATEGAIESWQQRKVASALLFVAAHPDDSRAVSVLVRIADESLQRGDLEQAATVAGVVTDLHAAGDTVVDNELLNDAWMLRGQAQFDMANYLAAEQAFSSVLHTMGSDDHRRQGIVDLLAASVYQHSEADLRAGDSAAAVQGFLRVSKVAPESQIAVQAQYDAAALLMQQQQWGQAEVVFRQLRGQSLPPAIAADMPARLAEVYVHQEKWLAAAQAYERVAQQDADGQRSRQALYRSAELYQKAGKTDKAMVGYRQYARQYPTAFASATEACFQLTELYRQTGSTEKRNYWLEQLIASHRRAGTQASDRSLFLAVSAASELADAVYRDFADIELDLPLRSSLKRKQRAMTQGLSAYERVLDYQVVEFASQARFRIGQIYGNFSADLLASERPSTLDADGLARYEMLLEEQAYPFEEKAIAIHETNARLARMDSYDDWVQRSYQALAVLMPGRYDKLETTVSYNESMY